MNTFHYNDYVKQAFVTEEASKLWSLYGLYDPASDDGPDRYNNKLYRMRYVIEAIPRSVSGDARALDLGCGAGVFLPALRNAGYLATAFDISAPMIERARELCALYGMDSDLVIGDCNVLPFADASHDLCICVGLIEHQQTDDLILREMRRVIRPGGTLIITIRNYLCPHVRYRSWHAESILALRKTKRRIQGRPLLCRGEDGLTKPFDSREHIPFRFSRALRRSGFTAIQHRYSHFHVLPFPWNVRRPDVEARLGKKLEALSRSPLGWLGSTGIIVARAVSISSGNDGSSI